MEKKLSFQILFYQVNLDQVSGSKSVEKIFQLLGFSDGVVITIGVLRL